MERTASRAKAAQAPALMVVVVTTTTNRPTSELTDQLRIWIDGTVYADPERARVAAVDHGLVVGDGVFEALKVTVDGPFTVGRHLARLTRSARAMGLPDPDHGLIREAIAAVLADRTFTDGKIRITYTGGRGPLGSHAAFGPPTLVVAADSRTVSDSSVAIVTAPWSRNEKGALAGVKSTSYGENVRALAYAEERQAAESILLNTVGHVCEGTGSNIFCVFGSQIVTPPLSAGPLAGITRELVLEWSDVSEENLTLAEAQSADEVFITSSLRDVQAVHRWDEVDYTTEGIGPRTQEVAETFARQSAESLEP
jgi:branched-chain amino acid aminotransferase